MEKPLWRRRATRMLVDSPHLRLRSDELELPDGTVIADYYVRESDGFVAIFAVTHDDRIVLVRQYRYGSDAIHLELPAGTLDAGEDSLDCAKRELLEETGFSGPHWEFVGTYWAEPVRSNSQAYVYLARDVRKTQEPELDPTEVIEVEEASFDEVRAMLQDGRIDAGHAVAAGYRVLDRLGKLKH
ncbi:MAG TPA: NUDIX hydrolase [Candidatus Tumulicola sp.]|jgi:8-oxo-dGTP pyrophosphatase MutT (NUDIX family)